MRVELRSRIGEALGVPRRRRDSLDYVESRELFLVIKPGGDTPRHHFTEPGLRPLLRQAVVAIAAAVESYVAEKACVYIAEALRTDELRRDCSPYP